ncbi:MAG: hypothetical protein HKO66_16815 [Saprospiraceae bacterium]|nr:hypothetical protein [Bacteroidia bacterium]NNE14675.1 hypothetical protein [Saprospiraceae bacterium]NNL93908.1 hypothetical protein [Saprospiraceae bacterium]
MLNNSSFKFQFSISLLTVFLFSAQSTAQLPTVACICELEALMLESKISNTQMVIEETENGFSYFFEDIEEPEVEEAKEKSELEVEEDALQHTEVKSLLVSRDAKDYSNRKKRKKRKKKVKRKKLKKYKGNCYRFN